jgi:hypothetical protein
MHNEGRRRGRSRADRSQLDWFGEDPWAETETQAHLADEERWHPDLWELDDEDDFSSEDAEEEWTDDPYDGWGPVRRRHR